MKLPAWLSHPLVGRLARLALGGVFLWAALGKLGDIEGLARDVQRFRMLPAPGVNLVAIVLPWIELVAGLSLLLGIRARAGALVTGALMAVFTAAVAFAMARGLSIECGCFGSGDSLRTGGAKLLVNLGMLALAALALGPRREPPAPSSFDRVQTSA